MTVINHPTSQSIDGPLLIDTRQLEALDRLLEHELGPLGEYRESMVRRAVDDRMSELERNGIAADRSRAEDDVQKYGRIAPLARQATVRFRSGQSATAETLGQIARQPELRGETATSFEVSLTSADVRIAVSARPGFDLPKLEFACEPFGQVTHALRYAVEEWGQAVAPSRWVAMWAKATWFPFHWLLWIAVTFGAFYLLAVRLADRPTARSTYEATLKAEARTFLAKPVTEGDIPKAIALLLKLSSGYVPPDWRAPTTAAPHPRYWIWWLYTVATIALSYRPSLHIGIGQGRQQVKRWRWWIRLVFVTVPAFVVTSLLVPVLVDRYLLHG